VPLPLFLGEPVKNQDPDEFPDDPDDIGRE